MVSGRKGKESGEQRERVKIKKGIEEGKKKEGRVEEREGGGRGWVFFESLEDRKFGRREGEE